MDINSIDRNTLSDLQRRNLAAWQLKQYEVRHQYGDRIQISNPIEEILSMTRPLTIPISSLDADKQVSIMLEEFREDPDGTVSLVHERGEMPMSPSVSNITLALEAKVDEYRELERMKTQRKRKKSEGFQVPAGYKLVKITDYPDQEVAADMSEDALNDLGIPVADAAAPEVKSDDAIKRLLDMLV